MLFIQIYSNLQLNAQVHVHNVSINTRARHTYVQRQTLLQVAPDLTTSIVAHTHEQRVTRDTATTGDDVIVTPRRPDKRLLRGRGEIVEIVGVRRQGVVVTGRAPPQRLFVHRRCDVLMLRQTLV